MMMRCCITHHNAPAHQFTQAFIQNAGMHEATRAIIKTLIADHKIPSERQLALDCNMSQTTLNRFLKGETSTLEFQHIQTLAHYFSLTVSQLIGEVPFDPDNKIRAVTLAMQQMPEYKKDVLVAASSSLVKPEHDSSTGTGSTKFG